MGALRHYLALRIKARTGFTSGILVWAAIALVCVALAIIFLIVAALIALAERYGALVSALILAACLVVIAIVAFVVCIALHKRTKERARLALAARQATPWLDPRLLGVVLQASRGIDPRLAAALLALPLIAGTALHWYGQRRLPPTVPQA
jgi:hypothetical protein